MNSVKIKYDGKEIEVPENSTYYDLCKSLNVEKNIIAVKINNMVADLSDKVEAGVNVDFVSKASLDGRLIYKSGIKHIFLVALKKVFPGADIHYEHSVPQGMLGEIKYDKYLSNDDLTLIKKEMDEIIAKDIKFVKYNIKRKDAIDFSNKNKEFEKADNIQNITDQLVVLYELMGSYNYFYSDMPYSTGAIDKYEIILIGENHIVFVMPSSKNDYEIPEYTHNSKIIDTFIESKNWLNKLKMPYISNLNIKVGNGKIKDFIKSDEIRFDLSIATVSAEIMKRPELKFIMIAGPSSSGKTTTTKKLAAYLEAIGYDAIKISTDDYFVNREDSPRDENGVIDYECLEAIDLEYLNNDLKKLLNGETIYTPTYNFISGKKEPGTKPTKMKDNSIFIIEGLHSLNDDLVPSIEKKLKYKIYLSPFTPLNIDRHNYVSTIDIRLLRRIVRDNRTRGYGVATTIQNWQIVRNGEEKYIFPFIKEADVVINTALAFEVGVLKVYIEPLLLSVGITSAYRAEAVRLLCFLKQFFPIPGEYVNKDSILREFIGGNDD